MRHALTLLLALAGVAGLVSWMARAGASSEPKASFTLQLAERPGRN